ncbi:MAG: dipeptide epimerase [Lewinellaceae bacterium]|nr:dipeptide epimerase [Lewinellaceae bacterium]
MTLDPIRRIRIFRLDIPLEQPFVISLETITHAHNILVAIETQSGRIGWGECSPYRSINGETQDTGIAIAPAIARALLGLSALDRVSWEKALRTTIAGHRCIKSAFDLALYDLAAQQSNLPLYAFLGGNPQKALYTDMTVGIGSPEKMAAAALSYQQEGFYAVKLKVGTTFAADIARVAAVRQAVGPNLPLRIDANQGWDVATAVRTLRALAAYDVEYCEQPIAHWDIAGLTQVRRLSPVPIMADEALFDHHDAHRLLQAEACDFFNIKLSKAGGIAPATRIVHLAEAAGLTCQVGCFSESRLAITALAHFALAHSAITQFDMDSPLMLAEDPVTGGIRYTSGGKITLPDTVGIGCSCEESTLAGWPMTLVE